MEKMKIQILKSMKITRVFFFKEGSQGLSVEHSSADFYAQLGKA